MILSLCRDLKEQYKKFAAGLLAKEDVETATLQYHACFKQMKEKNVRVYWQCGFLALAWAWCVGQNWTMAQILEFEVDQGPPLLKWVKDLIEGDGPIPQPPTKSRSTRSKTPERVRVEKKAWPLRSPTEKRKSKRMREKGDVSNGGPTKKQSK